MRFTMRKLSVNLKRRIACLVFILSPVGFGTYDLFAYEDDGQLASSHLFLVIVGIGSILAWCSFDAKIHDFVISQGLRFGIILVAAIAVPVYLVKTRGWPGALKLGLGLPAFAVSAGAYYVGWYAAYEIAALIGYF